MMYNNWGWSGMMGGFGFGWIFMFLFWVLVIWIIIAFVRGMKSGGCCRGHNNGGHKNEQNKKNIAMDILSERYAKGEIEKKEFEEKKKDLTN
jgi:putative membrane protein